MEPREKGDLCRKCDTLVLDTARHTRAEFLAIVARGDKVCAHLRSDGAGRVRFSDTPVKRRLAVVALSAALAACGEDVGITVGPPAPSSPEGAEHVEWVGQVVAPEPEGATRGEIAAPLPTEPPTATPAPIEAPTDVPAAEPVDPAPHGTRRGRVAPPRSAEDDEPVGLLE
jgi:hypothetical protein